jgi:hypothetical protein
MWEVPEMYPGVELTKRAVKEEMEQALFRVAAA